MMMNARNFPPEYTMYIRQHLERLDDSGMNFVQSIPYSEPTTALILSLFLGGLGIDRFYIGSIGIGIGKLLTFGGLGLWTLIDWFLIMGAARQRNYIALMQAIGVNPYYRGYTRKVHKVYLSAN